MKPAHNAARHNQFAITRITTGESSLPQARSGGPKKTYFFKTEPYRCENEVRFVFHLALLVPFRPWLNFGNLGVGGSRGKVAEPLPPDYLFRSSQRVCSLVSHVRLGFQQRCLSRSLIFCRDLQGCSQGAEETAHLRDVWHHLAVVDAYL